MVPRPHRYARQSPSHREAQTADRCADKGPTNTAATNAGQTYPNTQTADRCADACAKNTTGSPLPAAGYTNPEAANRNSNTHAHQTNPETNLRWQMDLRRRQLGMHKNTKTTNRNINPNSNSSPACTDCSGSNKKSRSDTSDHRESRHINSNAHKNSTSRNMGSRSRRAAYICSGSQADTNTGPQRNRNTNT